uniref:Protein kinase domain-containing protein n=1 Tax=Nothobranchius furzeri TaxID=105023 RepID=A0A8C6Q2C2_NOTFU
RIHAGYRKDDSGEFITMECISGSSLNSVSDTHAVSTGGQTTEKDSVTEMGIHESDSNLTWSPSDTEYSPLTLERGGKIIHTSDVYQVVGLLGTGSFGKVFKCRKEGTDETVAMKVFRKGNHWQAKREVNSHNQVSVLDLDKNNLIRLIDSFVYKDCFCLTFECLYLNLTELIIRRYEGLEVNDIRSIAQQVLLALRALKIIGMTHTDIKPNNIMLTAPQGPQSLNVKLINFGSARKTAELSEYSVMQNERYRLRILHADANSLIRFIDSFVYKDCFCLTFECLNTTFVELFKETRFKLQRVIYLRTVGQQMLLALQALKSVGVTHTDIKPDNVMIAHLDNQSVRVKLSDFGLARKTAELSEYSVMQTEGYRAPEVILGLPRDESIDMWGLGCMLGFLYLGNHLFPDDDFKALQCIVKHMGLPDKNALKEGWRVRRFFKFDRLHKWRHSFNLFDEPLDDLVRLKPAWSNAKGKKLFIDLLIKMLAVNPADRILPEDALSHPFI